jgi:hypothetical protein
MAYELSRKFSKEEVQMANKYTKKNLPGQKRNANQNYTKISFHPS